LRMNQDPVGGTAGASTEVAIAKSAPLVGHRAPGQRPEGCEEMPDEDRMPRRLRIVQPISHVGTAGNFRFEPDGEEKAALSIVCIYYWPSRVFFAPIGQAGPRVLCRSNDGIRPSFWADGSIADECRLCPRAQYQGPAKPGEKKPPMCSSRRNILAVEAGSLRPFVLELHGVSIQPTRAFLSYFQDTGQPLFSASVAISTILQNNDKGKYWQIVFGTPVPLPDDQVEQHRQLYELAANAQVKSQVREQVARSGQVRGEIDGPGDEEVPFY